MNRRKFLGTTGAAALGTVVATSPLAAAVSHFGKNKKQRIAMVGTGVRGISMWGKNIVNQYPDDIEFVGLCDINPGRLQFGKEYIGVSCPTFTDFEEMMTKTKPDTLIVTTVDSTHDEFIIKGMEMGANIITEKPMTTDEVKCQNILDAERRTGKQVIVTFNYRYAPLMTKIKELLVNKRIGDIVSVDFHWYLNTYHGASYFRRWHGLRDKGGTLLVHKSTHHFDLLNWWLNSDPEEVFAYGDLEHYGKNNPFRGENCRSCKHKEKCGGFYWDITKNQHYMNLYVANEQHDGYIRDSCLWRKEIDIFDKMAVQVKYANNVYVSYSLTTYSPYEGWRIGFNGTHGRIDAWEGIPWQKGKTENLSQQELHAMEMSQNAKDREIKGYHEIMVMDNFGTYESIKVPKISGGHGGGDTRMKDKIFKDPTLPDPYKHSAGTRDGAMSILVGVAARNSIEQQKRIRVADLTDLKPMAVRP